MQDYRLKIKVPTRLERISDKVRHAAFTVVEMLVALGVFGILIAFLFPALSRARNTSDISSCQSNLRQLGVAMAAYAQDNGDKFVPLYGVKTYYFAAPPGCPDRASYKVYWGDLLFPYLKQTKTFECPSMEGFEQLKGPPHGLYWDECPPPPGSGGGGDGDFEGGSGGGSNSCPTPPPQPPPDVNGYSYGLNAMLPEKRAWRYSGSVRDGARGLISSPAFGTCDLRRPNEAGTGPSSLVDPAHTFALVEVSEKNKNGIGAREPELCMDTQLDYGIEQPIGKALPPTAVVSARHQGRFNVLFADWHVKSVKFGSSKPSAWSVQND